MPSDELSRYFAGEALYGDDFGHEALNRWYESEKEAYADLGASDSFNYHYGYHALNEYCGFRWLPKERRFEHALGMGSAYGHEFVPLLDRVNRITVVDPSDAFANSTVNGVPLVRVAPLPSGDLPFAAENFDLVLAFGVLHHIPNVSHVITEVARCMTRGGFAVFREPICSMGDWRYPREGLTKNERGVPRALFTRILDSAGLEVVRMTPCVFSGTKRLLGSLGVWPYESRWGTLVDVALSRLLSWNYTYHRQNWRQKLCPSASAWLCRKP
jgi:SAM-dependent methyltransferase